MINIISPQSNLIETLAGRLIRSEKNLERYWIVFPEKRPGYYLRKTLAEKLGKSYLPPSIFSIDEFIDFIYEKLLGYQNPLVKPVDAISFLFELNSANSEKSRGSAFLTLDEFFAYGQKLFQDLEELKNGNIQETYYTVLDSLSGEKLPERTRTRLRRLSELYREFYKILEKNSLSTRATRLEKILQKLEPEHLNSAENIILAGFFLTSPSESALLKKLLQTGKTELFLIDGPGLDDFLDRLALSEGEISRDTEFQNSNDEPEINFYLSPDTHGQVLMLNQVLVEKVENPAWLDEKKVVVLPAMESLIPLYQQTLLALPENSFNISLGYPLARTPLYSFFDCLFNLIQTADEQGRLYAPYYLDFVLHPYTKNIYFPGAHRSSELTRILFHTLQETMNSQRGRLFWSLEEIESCPELRQRLDRHSQSANLPRAPEFLKHLKNIHLQTITPFFEIKNIGEFSEKLIRLLDFLSTQSTAPRHFFFLPYAQEFFNQFEDLRSSKLSQKSFQHLHSYFSLFRKLISEARVRFTGTPLHGLQVLGFWETRGLKFDEVFILDMNDEVIPGKNKIDSLLPYALRKELKLPTHEDQEKKYRYYLHLLLSGAKKAHLFFVENSEKEKSRYIEELIWTKQKSFHATTGQKKEASSFIRATTYRIALNSTTPKPVEKVFIVQQYLCENEYTASQLDCYLKCPLKFYYAYVLKLSEREEMAESLERAEIGTLVHQILHEYYQEYLGKNLTPDFSREKLEKIIDHHFQKNFPGGNTGNFYLMKKQIVKHLGDFIEHYQRVAVDRFQQNNIPTRIIALEKKFTAEHRIFAFNFKLAGKIDRIEKRGNFICLLDYKTSASEQPYRIKFRELDLKNRKSWPKAIGSLQLPFYQLLASEHFKDEPTIIYSALLILGKNRLSPEIEFSPLFQQRKKAQSIKGKEIFPVGLQPEELIEYQNNYQLMAAIIDCLLLEIIDQRTPFTPDGLETGHCQKCAFADFCGQ